MSSAESQQQATHTLSKHIANSLRNLYFGGNWTDVCIEKSLEGLSFDQLHMTFESPNHIARLFYHTHYYVRAALEYFRSGTLSASDTQAFAVPIFDSLQDWQDFVNLCFDELRECAAYIENLPDEQLWSTFASERHGSYYRNLQGTIEHAHYHLGQITFMKKRILALVS